MNNGAHKGGSPDAWETIHNSPGLQDLWQLHYAAGSDKAHNVSEMFIANLEENCEGKYDTGLQRWSCFLNREHSLFA
jgi:hypothetical protein